MWIFFLSCVIGLENSHALQCKSSAKVNIDCDSVTSTVGFDIATSSQNVLQYMWRVTEKLFYVTLVLFLQELKEQNELLYETKLVLEEQVAGINSKEERIGG